MNPGTADGNGVAPARGSARGLLADTVWLVHTSIVCFFVVAWALPWRWALWAALFGAVAMQVQWWLNGGMCVLTQLERVLRGHRPPPRTEDGGFIGSLAASVLGRPVPSAWVDAGTYGVLWAGASAAALRLVWW